LKMNLMPRNLWDELRLQAISEIAAATGYSSDRIEKMLETPGKEGFGDFAFPCFALSKDCKKTPFEIAEDIALKSNTPLFEKKVVGPYVNFYLKWENVSNQLLKEIDDEYGKGDARGGVVIDFSSPNPAHPFHMGTVRSTIIGESVARILEMCGWKATRVCYVNDLGRQAAILLFGYLHYAKGKIPEGKADVWLGELYFKINADIESKPEMKEQVEDILRRCEHKEKGYYDAGQRVFKWCIAGFRKNWKALGINFDALLWESNVVGKSKHIIQELKKKELTLENDGALVLNLEPHGLPSTIILRSSGGTGLYLTRDIASAIDRFGKYKPELNIYVTAEDQRLHFRQMFKTLELLGYNDIASASRHLAYSIVLLEGQKMSSRHGHVVMWDELLKEGIGKASEAVKKRWPKLSAKEVERRARQIALAAIVYYILKYDPEKPVNFMWGPALGFEGDSGPYLQYVHTRCASILRKAKKKVVKFDGSLLKDSREKLLLSLLAQYPSVLARAAKDMRPHYVAGYLYNLANAFSAFYEALPVLRADHGVREARLKLVEAVKIVLAGGLHLLGIASPERM
jgi:arginyl-tRNA synthetase